MNHDSRSLPSVYGCLRFLYIGSMALSANYKITKVLKMTLPKCKSSMSSLEVDVVLQTLDVSDVFTNSCTNETKICLAS